METRQGYEQAARGIAAYLAARQGADGAFPGPDHYGVAFALWLWSCFGHEFPREAERAWERLQREPPRTHGEFNAYALLHCRDRLGSQQVDALLRRIPFGQRHSANWMLLRAACASLPGPRFSPARSRLGTRLALATHLRAGFIHDRPGVRSVAYHAFCGALLADLHRRLAARWAGLAAVRAAAALLPLVLPNGDALYLGRGQEQIFGYGALLFLLEAAARLTADERYAAAARRVFGYLLRFRREDGSFPLVLLKPEPEEPWAPDANRPGWYTYNRYADYLPFLGCLLMKAARADIPPLAGSRQHWRSYERPGWWRVITRDRYTAVLSLPGGATTNDLAFPYVCRYGESLFPCYGGEAPRVDPEAMPLPYGRLANGELYAFRERLRYRFVGDDLAGVSPLVRHERRFEFGRDGFACRDEITLRRACAFASFTPANFLFRNLRPTGEREFETARGRAQAKVLLHPEGRVHEDAAVTASGALVALRHDSGEIRMRGGDKTTVRLTVRWQRPVR
jgi:hypothetical protein